MKFNSIISELLAHSIIEVFTSVLSNKLQNAKHCQSLFHDSVFQYSLQTWCCILAAEKSCFALYVRFCNIASDSEHVLHRL
jgi:hypothetical protein